MFYLLVMFESANTSPIFKIGSKSELGNYRPMFLIAVPCTIMESIIKDKMLKFAQENNIQAKSNQYGFTYGRSCLPNVLEALEDWTKALALAMSLT